MDNDKLDELKQLKRDTGIPHLPTQLTYECRMAVSGKGPRAYDWSDKPHRLIYDLCREIEAAAARRPALPDREAVARVIRSYIPDGFEFLDYSDEAAADILALLSPAQAEKVPDPRPGPVNCQHVLRREGKPYPRTCERCRLGPCPFYNRDGTPLSAAPKEGE
jgi:hypothetical protein